MLLPVSYFCLEQKYYFFVQIYRYKKGSDQICMQRALALSPNANSLNFRTESPFNVKYGFLYKDFGLELHYFMLDSSMKWNFGT